MGYFMIMCQFWLMNFPEKSKIPKYLKTAKYSGNFFLGTVIPEEETCLQALRTHYHNHDICIGVKRNISYNNCHFSLTWNSLLSGTTVAKS